MAELAPSHYTFDSLTTEHTVDLAARVTGPQGADQHGLARACPALPIFAEALIPILNLFIPIILAVIR